MRLISALGLALALVIGSITTVVAQVEERVIVPDVPGGHASVKGCYAADRTLYGPYRLTVCFQKPGTYKVRGSDGVKCNGKTTWTTQGKYVKATLERQSCNKGVAWAKGYLKCRARSKLDVFLDDLSNGNNQRVIVQDTPKVKVLKCTYDPTVKGEKSEVFFAKRI
jgi:hypothetical protein